MFTILNELQVKKHQKFVGELDSINKIVMKSVGSFFSRGSNAIYKTEIVLV